MRILLALVLLMPLVIVVIAAQLFAGVSVGQVMTVALVVTALVNLRLRAMARREYYAALAAKRAAEQFLAQTAQGRRPADRPPRKREQPLR